MNGSLHTFHKDERLRSRKLIEEVFAKGNTIVRHPYVLKWLFTELPSRYPAQIAISVPAKTFRKAVDRNRIKRLVREVYRKNKIRLYDKLGEQNKQCAILLIFTGKTIPAYEVVEKDLKLTLSRFSEGL